MDDIQLSFGWYMDECSLNMSFDMIKRRVFALIEWIEIDSVALKVNL